MKISLRGTLKDEKTVKVVEDGIKDWRGKQKQECKGLKSIGFTILSWIVAGSVGYGAGYFASNVLGSMWYIFLTIPLAGIINCAWNYPLYWCMFMRKQANDQQPLTTEEESNDQDQNCCARCLLSNKPPGIWCLMCLIGCPFNTLGMLVGIAIAAGVLLPILLYIDGWTISARLGLAIPIIFVLLIIAQILLERFTDWFCLKVQKKFTAEELRVKSGGEEIV